MANLEWEVPHSIHTPIGDINLNTVLGGTTGPFYYYQVQPDSYKIAPTLRITEDNVSQQDGSVLHPRFTSGLTATMKVDYTIVPSGNLPDFVPACGQDVRLMHEGLMRQLRALMIPDPTDPNTAQRLIWTPTGFTGGNTRLMTGVLLSAWPEPSWEAPGWGVTFSLESDKPYAIDSAQVSTAIGAALIPNDGTAPFYPVIRVAGATSTFTITNLDDTSQQVTYNGTAIGGGHFAEIDFFAGTIFLDGSSTDLIASLDPTATDFFTIQPGGTNVSITGASATVLSNNAYC